MSGMKLNAHDFNHYNSMKLLIERLIHFIGILVALGNVA